MVRVTLHRRREAGDLVGFDALGHTGYAEHGSDIVCAAVSALTTVTVLGLQARLGLDPYVEVDEESGRLVCRLDPGAVDPGRWQRAQDLLETLALGLREIERDYRGYVAVEEVAR
ncbi:MAG: ribosomal-processing cysteine protease Prp [Limnochordia bacterium]